MPKKDGTETVAEQEERFKDERLQHFQSLPKTFNEAAAEAVTSQELTGNFEQVEKETLVGKPFIVIDWDLQGSEYDATRAFAIVRVITADNQRLLFTDGGVGITPVLQQTEKGTKIVCKKGLRKSEYETTVDGKIVKGLTWYLN